MRYCGRDVSDKELAALQAAMAEHPDWCRTDFSRWFCRTFDWRKPDGGLKEVSCRVAFLRMERDGLITLPPRQSTPPSPRLKLTHTTATDPGPLVTTPAGLMDLRCDIVTAATSTCWNEYMERYHYLGSLKLPGAQLRYFVRTGDQVLALVSFSAAAWMVASRDAYIGWDHEQRRRNLHLVVNQSRFLVLPWISSPNLCSRLQSLLSRRLAADWQVRYAYRPVLLETFVQKDRFTGTSYKASNWRYLGDTTGRGKLDKTNRPVKPIKGVWVYPLIKGFRRWLCREGSSLR